MPSLVSSSPTISRRSRPLAKISTRSQISASCSASELAQITDMPSAAALRSAAKICWRVPTSTPCVGSSSSSSEGDAVHPARDQHLLRVAAGQRRQLQDGIVGPDLERGAELPRLAHHRAVAHAAAAEEAADVGQEHVVDDLQAVDAAGSLPVGGQQRETEVDRARAGSCRPAAGPPLRRWRCRPSVPARAPNTR